MGPSLLRYGIVSKTATYWNLYVALDCGFYAKEGLDVQTIVTGSTAATIGKLIAGEIDLAGCSPDELISAQREGADLVVVGGIINRPASRIVSAPDLREIHQLAGTRVGVNQVRGSVSMVLKEALRAAGLPEGTYDLVDAGATPEMAGRLRAGELDAAMLTAPFDLDLIAEGFSGLLDVSEILGSYAFATLNARRQWIADQQPVVAAFFRATREAGQHIASRRRRNDCLGTLTAHTGLAGPVLDRTYEIYARRGVLSRKGEVSQSGLRAVLRLMRRQRLLAGRGPAVSDFLWPHWIP